MANWRENLEKLRSWIDGEQSDGIAEKVIKAHQNKSASEVFLQKLLTSIEELLKKKSFAFRTQTKPTCLKSSSFF